MRFSRHAKNRMRRDKVDAATIEQIVLAPESLLIDDVGNPIAVGADMTGRTIEVVLALDDPDFVITVIAKRIPR